ncbi:phosphatase PAP2 family protein [Altericroceibacterium spongiae]|uniref:Phosphatase PAP2 family protein n=2 Tax=Altericroceibacterium spongiae TaxID=2320269 RepID=A0A420EF57_9SPHN|nr:phosphatase PAP2 family protein [Altericroceibacterium spongiae]
MAGHSGAVDGWGAHWLRPASAPMPIAQEAMRDITALGGVTLRNLLLLCVAAALMIAHHKQIALWLVIVALSGWLTESVLKYGVARARPDMADHLAYAGGPGFPSGHSFNATLIALALSFAIRPFLRSAGLQYFAFAVALMAGLLVAWSRVWLGVHYLSDVLAGWLGGTAWALFGALLAPRHVLPLPGAGNETGA